MKRFSEINRILYASLNFWRLLRITQKTVGTRYGLDLIIFEAVAPQTSFCQKNLVKRPECLFSTNETSWYYSQKIMYLYIYISLLEMYLLISNSLIAFSFIFCFKVHKCSSLPLDFKIKLGFLQTFWKEMHFDIIHLSST